VTVKTSKFVGERLTEAREAYGVMTKSSLADLLDISISAASQYENNICNPRPELVSLMAKKLNVKEAFFFKPVLSLSPNPIFWRSRHSATKTSRTIAERRFGWAKSITDEYLKC